VLDVRDIDVFYGDLQALSGVTFHVEAGEVVSVIGSNGAGKSTALRAISGILRPRSGQMRFKEIDITRVSPHRIVELGISHVPEGRQLFPTMTVIENLEMGAQSPRTKALRVETMEAVFGFFPRLKERLRQKAGTLSGGEQQMLAMGRGLMAKPEILVLDEPSLGLAPLLVTTIFEIIRRINAQSTSILLVEQNVFNALNLSHRGYVLENGRMAMSGEGRGLLENPHIRKTYLGL
jgi:branched-chain amino acid transport system ATP-binding protein